jgi:hypothetical protein
MPSNKSTITFYTSEAIKHEVQLLAKEDMRSVSSAMNVIILDYIRRMKKTHSLSSSD